MRELVCARKKQGVMRCVGVEKARSPTTDINSTASLSSQPAQLTESERCSCAEMKAGEGHVLTLRVGGPDCVSAFVEHLQNASVGFCL